MKIEFTAEFDAPGVEFNPPDNCDTFTIKIGGQGIRIIEDSAQRALLYPKKMTGEEIMRAEAERFFCQLMGQALSKGMMNA